MIRTLTIISSLHLTFISTSILPAVDIDIKFSKYNNFPSINFKFYDSKKEESQIYNDSINETGDDDAHLTATQIIVKYGYPMGNYYVKTEDNYILNLHRIPHGKNVQATKGSVLLMHGILGSSADWVLTGPEKGFAFILADHGYDVWLGNARGNTYSRNHSYLDPNYAKFWQFSWHEIGFFDIPATVDYILEQTGEKQTFYIAHSQGTTAFYVMCSMKPNYNDKIKAQFSLAPVAFMSHMTSPLLRALAPFESGIEILLDSIGVSEFLPSKGFLSKVGQTTCTYFEFNKVICENALFLLCGFNKRQFNLTLLPTLLAHDPAGSSTRQLLHFSQEVNSGHFRQWDYGFWSNLKHYGSWSPPDYPLEKVNAPVYLFLSRNDWLSSMQDVQKLFERLGNAQGKFLVSDFSFNHMDFVFGIDAPKILYPKVISLMMRH